MYLRVWKKGETNYASIVKSTRIGKEVKQETVVYIGEVTEDQIPYLKAAFSKDKPKLVYKDGSVYEPNKQ